MRWDGIYQFHFRLAYVIGMENLPSLGATNLPQVLWGVETKCQWLTSILLLTIDF